MDSKRLVALALICIGVAMYVQRNGLEAGEGHGNDFAHLYLGARAVELQINPYDGAEMQKLAVHSGIERMNPYVYPPLTAILFRPIAKLNYEGAKAAWFLINHLFIFLSFWLLLLIWKPKEKLLVMGFLCLVFATFYPLTRTLTAGQLNAALLFLLVAAYYLETVSWSIPAGAILGLAAVIKVYPALFLVYYVGRGDWKAVISMVVSVVVLLGVCVLVVGLPVCADYSTVLGQMRYGSSTWEQYGQDYQTEPFNQAPSALFFHLFTTNRGTTGLFHAPWLALALSWAAGLAVLGFLLAYLVLASVPVDKGFSLTLLSALLIPSLLWDHYMLLALLPFVVVGSRFEAKGGPIRVVLWAISIALISLPFNFRSEVFKAGIWIPLASFKLYPLLVLYFLVWIMGSKSAPPQGQKPQQEPEGDIIL